MPKASSAISWRFSSGIRCDDEERFAAVGETRQARGGAAGADTEPPARMKYCPECASTLTPKRIDGVERKACAVPECGFVQWDNPVPVVAALVQYQTRIVLARNAQWPEGMFSLVTGYLEKGETPETAVAREVKEELGLDGEVRDLIGCYSFSEKNQIILAHWVVANGALKLGNEIAEVRLLSREELKRWRFGRLAITSAIVRRWLEK